jgi:hypothetical protein
MEAAGAGAAVATLPRSEEWLRAARLTRLLSWLSLVWLGIEGAVAIVAGVMAGSIALIAFGLDSAIEGVASVVIIWRFSGSRLFSEGAVKRHRRMSSIAIENVGRWPRGRVLRRSEAARSVAMERVGGLFEAGRG